MQNKLPPDFSNSDVSTMTGFVTTLVLPVILWLVQRLLGRMGL